MSQGEVGPYTLAVGFRIEPAFEDVVNALDFIVTQTSDGKPISVSNVGSAIIQEHRLAKPEQAFGADNRYNSWFKPTIDGTYAFRIQGEISDLSDPQAGPYCLMKTGSVERELSILRAVSLAV